MEKSPTLVSTNLLSEILRGPRPVAKARQEPAPATTDVSRLVARIEHASKSLTTYYEREKRLDERIYELTQRELQLMAQLDQAADHAIELEKRVAAEAARAARAEHAALALTEQIAAKDSALREAQHNLDTLAAAIERDLDYAPDVRHPDSQIVAAE